jgi:hypothetical protein
MTQTLTATGTPLRRRMIEDMTLAGLAAGTQQAYVGAIRGLAARYGRVPDQLTEEEVRAYLLDLRERGAARGTFKIAWFAIKFLFTRTLGVNWELFGKKRSASPARSGFSTPCPTGRPAICWIA